MSAHAAPTHAEANAGQPGAPSPFATQPEPHAKRSHRWILWVVLALAVLAAALLVGWLPHHKRNKEVNARAQAQKNAVPIAEVQTVHRVSAEQELTLPGTVTPLKSAHIYAQAAGYLKVRYVDIGDAVHKGQVLGVVSAPELDASVAQAAAAVQQSRDAVVSAQSAARLQEVTYARVHTLLQHGILAQQDDDASRAALESAQANLQAAQNVVEGAQAALVRARVMADYEQIRAPLTGTVTARNVEVGSLVSAAGAAQGMMPAQSPASNGGPPSGGAQGGELFDVADLHSLAVFISVPEQNAAFVQTGQPVELTFSELPGESFQGKVTRSSDSLNQQTRTLLAEVKVDDSAHHLRPGMYASAAMHYKAKEPGILIPGDSLITMARGQFVPLVVNNVVQMRPVRVGRDLGTQIYVVDGLQDGENIVVNPNDSIKQGAKVNPRPAPAGQKGEEAQPSSGGKSGQSGGGSKSGS